MDLTSILEGLAAQGSMFWAASGSVALGGTLILVALVAQLKRLKRSRLRQPDPRSEMRRKIAETGPVACEIPESALHETPAPERFKRETVGAELSELRELANRLRSAADRLEDFRRDSAHLPATAEDSPLKESRSGVDYVFRAGLG